MSTPVIDKLTDVQTSVVDAIAQVKEPVVKGVTVVVDFVHDRIGDLPALPYADQIPTPVELINNQYKFAKSFIDTNKDIALSVAKAAAPVTDQVLDRKKATPRKASTKKASTAKAA